jgi:succinate dehydrogenase / fumarate reductase, flavoprotein subunit
VDNIKVEKSDVLIIGSGGAGLRAAIELYDNKVDVLVVGKCKKRDAHTIMATGGINASLANMDLGDSWMLHAADTIKDGGFINDSEAVNILCQNAPKAVKELANWKCPFHRDSDGKITQRFFGAATYRRACFVGDYTGLAVLNTLVNQVQKRKIRFKSEIYIFSLLANKGKVNGAIGLDIKKGRIIIFHSKVLVLATGGHSKVFNRSSSRFWENTGDGIYLANKLGAEFMDMEMFQFHPTGMLWPKDADGKLVTESVRGEGGILTNSRGERFMDKYDGERMELSARDVVARAIYMEVRAGRGTKRGGVYLDISHKPKKYILKRLPTMHKQFKNLCNIDISEDKMEVAPTAHYSMGGLHINHSTGRTSVPNLYAIGEVTGGVHGGNRLGGNSLAEIIVFGRLTGEKIVRDLRSIEFLALDDKMIKNESDKLRSNLRASGLNPIQVKKQIQELMWTYAGVVRNEKMLSIGLDSLSKYKKIQFKIKGTLKMNEKLIAALDVINMVPTCEMIFRSAMIRKESRAAHYREDYPKTKSGWKKNILCKNKNNEFEFYTKDVSKIPGDIGKYINYKKPRNSVYF